MMVLKKRKKVFLFISMRTCRFVTQVLYVVGFRDGQSAQG